MESHSSKRRNMKRRKNYWCHVCRKRFDKQQYRLHIATEHPYDPQKMDDTSSSSDDDQVPHDKKLFIDSERSSGKKLNIKPTETSHKKSGEQSLEYKSLLLCEECKRWCRGPIGLQMHINTVHRSDNESSDTPQSDDSVVVIKKHPNQRKIKAAQENGDHKISLSNDLKKINTQIFSNVDQLSTSDTVSYKNESSVVSAGSSKQKSLSNNSIKIKPTKITYKKYKRFSKMMPKCNKFIKYRECGMLCSGKKEIKMHTNMVHKLSNNNSSDSDTTNRLECKTSDMSSDTTQRLECNCNDASQSDTTQRLECHCNDTSQADYSMCEDKQQAEQTKIKSAQDATLSISNDSVSFNPNSQPGLFDHMHQLHIFLTAGNQPNVQDPLQSNSLLENQPAESSIKSAPENAAKDIPNFENSESYMRWLRKFTYKCRKQKYPLSREMCDDIKNVLDDVAFALGSPVGFENMKIQHYIFMRLYRILCEVMTGQMRYSLSQ